MESENTDQLNGFKSKQRCCARCRNHYKQVPLKGHKCPYNDEDHADSCYSCSLVLQRKQLGKKEKDCKNRNNEPSNKGSKKNKTLVGNAVENISMPLSQGEGNNNLPSSFQQAAQKEDFTSTSSQYWDRCFYILMVMFPEHTQQTIRSYLENNVDLLRTLEVMVEYRKCHLHADSCHGLPLNYNLSTLSRETIDKVCHMNMNSGPLSSIPCSHFPDLQTRPVLPHWDNGPGCSFGASGCVSTSPLPGSPVPLWYFNMQYPTSRSSCTAFSGTSFVTSADQIQNSHSIRKSSEAQPLPFPGPNGRNYYNTDSQSYCCTWMTPSPETASTGSIQDSCREYDPTRVHAESVYSDTSDCSPELIIDVEEEPLEEITPTISAEACQ